MRWLLFVLLVACGGKSVSDGPDAAAECKTTPGDVGDCFTNVRLGSPSACGLSSGAAQATGATCERVCGAGAKCCTFDGAETVRCEYCACR